MLNSNEKGYAVMNKKLTAYSLEDTNLETCKRYCHNGDVIAERIPYTCGFSVRIMWYKFWKPFHFKYHPFNILWLHFSFQKEQLHKTGRVVYESTERGEGI
jgi:hypothetical protein